MTVPATERRAGPYNCNGVTTAFGFTFKVFDEADIRVVKADEEGVETDAVLNSDYTVSLNADQDASPGGTVNYLEAPADGTVTILSDLEFSQPTQLPDGGAYRAQTNMNALDRIVMLVQQLRELFNRAIKFPVSDDDSISTTLPTAGARADTLLGFDEAGALEVVPRANFNSQVASATASAAAAAASATNAEASRDSIDNRIYPGTYASDPTTRPDGTAIQDGDVYFTTGNVPKVYGSGVWALIAGPSAADLANSTDVTKGATLVGYKGQSVAARLGLSGPRQLTNWFKEGVPGKKIAWVGDSTTLQLFTGGAITTGGPASLAVPARYAGDLPDTTWYNFGRNGGTLSDFVALPATANGINAIIAADPDLIVFSYGINDVRQGATTTSQLVALIESAINTLQAALPSCDFVLRMPNSFLTTDVGAAGYVVPNGSAQAYSTILRDAYRQLVGRWPNVAVYDSQKNLFDETSRASTDVQFMTDQIHPNVTGYRIMIDQLVQGFIGAGAVERMDNGYGLTNPAMFRLGLPGQYNAGRARDAIAKVGYRLAPTYYPEVVFGPDYELVLAGVMNGAVTSATTSPTIAVFFASDGFFEPQAASGDLRLDDVVVQMADAGLAACMLLHTNGGIKNTTAINIISGFGASSPNALATQAAGKPVAIYRNKYANSANAKAAAVQKQYTARAVFRVTASALGSIELSSVGSSKDSQWTPRAGDVLSFQDIGDITLTSAMTLTGNSSGDNWKINQTGTDFTTTSTLCQIAGTGSPRAETNLAQPLRLDVDGTVASTTLTRIFSRNARYKNFYGRLDTPDAANPTTVQIRTTLNGVSTLVATVTFAAASNSGSIAYVFSSNVPVLAGVPVTFQITSGGAGVQGLHIALDH